MGILALILATIALGWLSTRALRRRAQDAQVRGMFAELDSDPQPVKIESDKK